MEKQFKRLFCALLALGLSTSAFANSAVVVPSQHGGFKVGIDALYLRPGNSDLNYAVSLMAPVELVPFSTLTNASVDPSYSMGFYVQLGYLIPCTGNDVTLGYTSLHTHDTDQIDAAPFSAPVIEVAIVPLTIFGSSNNVFSAASKATFNLDVLDLEFGQRLTSGSYDLRMFAGVRYANIEHVLSTSGFESTLSPPVFEEFTSHYRGIGPRIGVEGRYCLQSGFGIDGNLSTSLLAGKIDPKFQGFQPLNIPNASVESNGSRTRIVPVLEAKLGVDYTHIMDRCAKAAVVLEAGYQMTNYFNAIEHAAIVPAVGDLNPYFFVPTSTTDVAFDGPYVGIKYYA